MNSSFDEERLRAVERNLAARSISDERVLAAFRAVPRELFVPESEIENAYDDRPLHIGSGQTISQPYMAALMTQHLRLEGDERVLEIGTGSGYQTAILALLAGRVCTVERLGELAEAARRRIEALSLKRIPGRRKDAAAPPGPPGPPGPPAEITYRVGDGTLGWPEEAPFDRIIVTAAAPRVPGPLREQLADGGLLVVPVGGEQEQCLVVVERKGAEFRESRAEGCIFVKLIGEAGWPDENFW